MIRRPPRSTLFPTRRSSDLYGTYAHEQYGRNSSLGLKIPNPSAAGRDRKSTRLNSSHPSISYAVFCLKKKKKQNTTTSLPCITNTQLVIMCAAVGASTITYT